MKKNFGFGVLEIPKRERQKLVFKESSKPKHGRYCTANYKKKKLFLQEIEKTLHKKPITEISFQNVYLTSELLMVFIGYGKTAFTLRNCKFRQKRGQKEEFLSTFAKIKTLTISGKEKSSCKDALRILRKKAFVDSFHNELKLQVYGMRHLIVHRFLARCVLQKLDLSCCAKKLGDRSKMALSTSQIISVLRNSSIKEAILGCLQGNKNMIFMRDEAFQVSKLKSSKLQLFYPQLSNLEGKSVLTLSVSSVSRQQSDSSTILNFVKVLCELRERKKLQCLPKYKAKALHKRMLYKLTVAL